MFNKDIKAALARIEALIRKPPPRDRQFLVSFLWSNEFTNSTGQSSMILTLPAGELMTGEKVKDLQKDILKALSKAGHVNDPENVAIIGFSELEN